MVKKMQLANRIEQIALFLGFIGLMLLVGSLGGCMKSNISDRKIEFVDLNRAVELYESQQRENDTVLFIDTRRPDRFAQGHIPGAQNLRTPDIDLRYGTDPKLDRYKNLVIYGENPGTANTHAMAKRMIEAGYNSFMKKRIKVFLGGWHDWENTGLPMEVSDTKETEE